MANQRDYYADLGLPRDADGDDIKKQFRKLALKYHPDRNPGHEIEVNAQFQIIQAANEVLSNPAEKAKYDATLGRSSNRYPGASGVRGNPWANAGAQFPTPPRRSTASRNPQSGAQRWQDRFSSGVPPTAKQAYGSDAEAKKNAAKAFENMRKDHQNMSRSDPKPPPPPPPRQPPRTEFARQRAEASFGARKSGYYPRSTMPGDEPPVSNQNYASTERREVPPTPPQRPGRSPMPDPLSQFRGKNNSTNSHDENAERSSSASKPSGSNHRDPETRVFGDDYAFNDRDGAADFHTEASFRHHAHSGSNAKEHAEHRFPAAENERESSKTEDGPSMYDRPCRHEIPGLSEMPTQRFRDPIPGAEQPLSSARLESSRQSENSPSGSKCGSVTLSAFEEQQTSILNDLIDNKLGVRSWSKVKPHSRPLVNKCQDRAQCVQLADKDAENSFSFPVDDDTFRESATYGEPSFGKASADNIHTNFANDDGSHAWQFNANTAEGDAHASSGTAFNPEGWSDKFNAQTFVPQPVPAQSASPTRAASRANSKKTKIRPTAGTAAAVVDSSSDEETYEWGGRNSYRQPRNVAADSPQAMDIDSPNTEPAGMPPPPRPVRNIPVEPSNPEWRAGDIEKPATAGMPLRPAKVPLDANAVGSEDSEEFRANFEDLKKVSPLSHQGEGLDSFDELKDNLPFESRASDVPPNTSLKTRPLSFPAAPGAPRLPPTMAIDGLKPNTDSWRKYLSDFEDYLRKWDAYNEQAADYFTSRKSLIRMMILQTGHGFLGTMGETNLHAYCSWVQQDNDVRRRWLGNSEEHERRMHEFMAFREKMQFETL